MALNRRYLKELGLTEAQAEGVMEAHEETVNGLKSEIEAMKGDAARLEALEQALEDREDWKARHDAVAEAFEAYRAEAEATRREAAVRAAYRRLLEAEHIDPRRYEVIERVTDYGSMRLDGDGNLVDAQALAEAIRRDWADFVVTRLRRGARVQTPPGGEKRSMGKAEILSIRDPAERQRAIAENHDIFGF